MSRFEVIPAIDLVDGRVVQLQQGDPDRRTVFSDDPAGVARRWVEAGAPRIHVVDLGGAFEGAPRHLAEVRAVIDAAEVPVQVAGGVRDLDTARMWLESGAERIVVGTAAVTDPDLVAAAVAELGPRLVVALDSRDGELRTAGWTEGSGVGVVDAAKRMSEVGVERLLCTDIGRDGMLAGPNLGLYRDLVGTGACIIASGGIRSIADLRALAEVEGVEGAVVGTAVYSGEIELAEAVRTLAGVA